MALFKVADCFGHHRLGFALWLLLVLHFVQQASLVSAQDDLRCSQVLHHLERQCLRSPSSVLQVAVGWVIAGLFRLLLPS